MKKLYATLACGALLIAGLMAKSAVSEQGGCRDAGMGGPAVKLDTAKIESLTGLKGAMNDKEGVFKVSYPRSDILAVAAGVKLTPPMD